MDGIAIGTVKENWDEDYPGMVKVEYVLGLAGKSETGWLSVMSSFAGAGYGAYQLPEVGSRVVVGFEGGDPNRGVVLGNIWSPADTLPDGAANENNSKKMWKSKAGYEVYVDEEEIEVSFADPEHENSLVWSSKEGSLTVDVKEKVVLTLGGEPFLTIEKEKITIDGTVTVEAEDMMLEAKSLTLKTSDSISIDPGQKLSVTGDNTELTPGMGITMKTKQWKVEGTTMELQGTQMKLEGKQLQIGGTMVEIKAQASGKMESGGIMEVKGAMLKLN